MQPLSFVTILLVCLAYLLAGCSSVSTGLKSEQAGAAPGLPGAILVAQDLLAERYALSRADISIQEFHAATWTDDCLGFPIVAEICTQTASEGYQGLAVVGENRYEFRAEKDGSQVRLIPGAVIRARELLSQQLEIEPEAIDYAGFEAVDWQDSCFEIDRASSNCQQITTPGYLIQLFVSGNKVEFHTDLTGNIVLLASP